MRFLDNSDKDSLQPQPGAHLHAQGGARGFSLALGFRKNCYISHGVISSTADTPDNRPPA